MQRYLLASLILFGLGIFLSFGNSNGPAAVQGKDRTGGPLADGFCVNCHSSGAFNPAISVQLFNEDLELVDKYQPNEPYTIRVTINADTTAQRYGFQLTALYGADNLRAGTLGSIPGTHVTVLNNRQYAEHGQSSTNNTWDIPWTAPVDGVGDIRFYAAGIAANNSSTSSGDGATRLNDPVVIAEVTSGSNDLVALTTDLQVAPNPVQTQANLSFTLRQAMDAQVQLFNLQGQLLYERKEQLAAGENNLTIDMSHLPRAHYRAVLTNGQQQSAVTIIRQ